MIETSGRIIKGDLVELEGRYHLGLAQHEVEECEPAQTTAVSSAPQARVVENHPDHAVIEVTCSCGAKVSLKCEYAGSQMPENS